MSYTVLPCTPKLFYLFPHRLPILGLVMDRRSIEVKVGRREKRVGSTVEEDLGLYAHEEIVAFETRKIYFFY
jgi:hypothetical protein